MNAAELIAALQASAAVAPKPVDVEGWGRVFVRPLTVGEVDAARTQGEPNDGRELARGVCRMLCDEAGNRLLDPMSEEHVALVNRQPFAALQKLTEAVKPASGN